MSRELREDPEVETGAGATPEEVAEAERALGVAFPESYRRFLGEFGWAAIHTDELYGLGLDVPRHLDLVRLTLSERAEMRPRMPLHLVPLLNDGAGNHYALDTSRIDGGECPVVVWDHELGEDQEPGQEAAGFTAWLAKRLAFLKDSED